MSRLVKEALTPLYRTFVSKCIEMSLDPDFFVERVRGLVAQSMLESIALQFIFHSVFIRSFKTAYWKYLMFQKTGLWYLHPLSDPTGGISQNYE